MVKKVFQKCESAIFGAGISSAVIVGVALDVIMGRENNALLIGDGPVEVNDRVGLRECCREKVVDIVNDAHRRAWWRCSGACRRRRTWCWFGNAVVKPPVVVRRDEDVPEGEEAVVESSTFLVFRAGCGMK